MLNSTPEHMYNDIKNYLISVHRVLDNKKHDAQKKFIKTKVLYLTLMKKLLQKCSNSL